MTTELGFDDLVEAWIRGSEFRRGRVHDYWTARFDLMCLEFDIFTSEFSSDQHFLWWFGGILANESSHRFGSGILEVPAAVADFMGPWRRQVMAVDAQRSQLLRGVLAELLRTVAPRAIDGTTTLERLIEAGLPRYVPDPFDEF